MRWGYFAQGMTYSGHPVSAAVALECLNIYHERDIVTHVQRVGQLLQDGVAPALRRPLLGG